MDTLELLAGKLESNPQWRAAAESLTKWMLSDFESARKALEEARVLFANVFEAYESDAIAYIEANPPSPRAICALIFVAQKGLTVERATKAAEALHNKPGGSRSKQKQMRDAWATGRYTSRDRCAEEECGALGISLSAARKALRNTPKPT